MKWFYLRVLTVDKNYFDKYIEVLKSFFILKSINKTSDIICKQGYFYNCKLRMNQTTSEN